MDHVADEMSQCFRVNRGAYKERQGGRIPGRGTLRTHTTDTRGERASRPGWAGRVEIEKLTCRFATT